MSDNQCIMCIPILLLSNGTLLLSFQSDTRESIVLDEPNCNELQIILSPMTNNNYIQNINTFSYMQGNGEPYSQICI